MITSTGSITRTKFSFPALKILIISLLFLLILSVHLFATPAFAAKRERSRRTQDKDQSSSSTARKSKSKSTSSSSFKKNPSTTEPSQLPTDLHLTVRERGLVQKDIDPQSVLNNHNLISNQSCSSPRHFQNHVLAYVTPWSKEGHRRALEEAARGRITHVSTVVYHIEPGASEVYGTAEDHFSDPLFYEKLRQAGVKIVPRLLFSREKWFDTDYINADCDYLAHLIATTWNKKGFDGVVLEYFNAMLATSLINDPTLKDIIRFSNSLITALKKRNLLVYVVAIPFTSSFAKHHRITPSVIHKTMEAADGISILAYDASNIGAGEKGPIAPISWVKEVVQFFHLKCSLKKLFVGLNFYGTEVISPGKHARHLVSKDYLQILEYASRTNIPIQWVDSYAEHIIVFKESRENLTHYVAYPSLQSIAARISLAQEYDLHLAIWELGQGLEYFMDLF